jgi:hypothetical protein
VRTIGTNRATRPFHQANGERQGLTARARRRQ